MHYLEIDLSERSTVEASFDKIAGELFNNYVLLVNNTIFRLVDLEFYYYSDQVFKDVYAHQHDAQLSSGKWYFHGSGMDITIGNGQNHGGILVRAIAEISPKGNPLQHYIIREIHGPLNAKTAISAELNGAFDDRPNHFYLKNVGSEKDEFGITVPSHIIKTPRIGLNSEKDTQQTFHQAKYRYVIFPHLKLKDKSKIAKDMQVQYPDLTTIEINKLFGSKFL